MTILTTHARQVRPYLPSRSYLFSLLVGGLQELAGWYTHRINQRALEGLSMMDLKDIGYPTACRDEPPIRNNEMKRASVGR